MLMKTESNLPLEAVEINVREDVGVADVWLHKNIEEVRRTDEEGNTLTAYVADEVYFMHAYTDTLAEELMESFDEWWEYGKTWEHEKQLTKAERELKAAYGRIDELEDCLLEMSETVYA